MWSRNSGSLVAAALRVSLNKIYPTRGKGTSSTNANSKLVVSVSVDEQGIGIATLQRPPVHALNFDVLQQLTHAIDEAEKNQWKGLIFTADSPKIFTAGFDLMELYNPDPKRICILWTTLQEMALKLFKSTFVSATAINGYSAAGGCLLSILTDYRVMVDGKFVIGLNDSVIGITPPLWVISAMSHVMTPRNAEIAISGSVMYSPKDALKVGLIDELASDKEDAIAKCKQYIRSLENVPPNVRAAIRQGVKMTPMRYLQENQQKSLEDFMQMIIKPETQQILGSYIKSLKERKNTKSLESN